MKNYIDAEKVKAHIQYLIKKDNYELFDVPELLSFIDSLQQETSRISLEKEEQVNRPKLSDNLEEVAEEYGRNTFINECMENGVCDDHDLSDAFKAGAEWQKEQDNNFERFKDYTDKALISLEEAREQGRQEMKEQMMKEAVEGYVNYYEDSGGILMAEAQVGFPYHDGDKVHVIIVKE